MRVYLDLCCFNRPFDDQSQLLIRLQTEAKLAVQRAIQDGEIELAWSSILDLENNANPDRERRVAVSAWSKLATVDLDTSLEIERRATSLMQIGLKALDALHIASAIEGQSEYFLTTDKGILKRLKTEQRIQVIDPIDFIRQQSDERDED